MNWKIVYDKIIQKAQRENRVKSKEVYYEKHHIMPKCLGGSNDPSNLVLLTTREHFFCHKILVKIYAFPALVYALHMMSNIKRYNCPKGDQKRISKDFSRLASENCPWRRLTKEQIQRRAATRSKYLQEHPEVRKAFGEKIRQINKKRYEKMTIEERIEWGNRVSRGFRERRPEKKVKETAAQEPKAPKRNSNNHWLKGKKLPEEIKLKGQITQSLGRVLCVETGEIYISSRDAENKNKDKGWHHGGILNCCRGKTSYHRGYTFRWADGGPKEEK